MDFLGESGDAVSIDGVAEFLDAACVQVESFAHVGGKAGTFGLAGLHGVERGGLGDGKFVQVVLKFAIAAESHAQDHADGRGGIDAELLRESAHA